MDIIIIDRHGDEVLININNYYSIKNVGGEDTFKSIICFSGTDNFICCKETKEEILEKIKIERKKGR